MTAKLLQISAYTRRAPSDRYAAIRAEKTAELFNDVHGEMLERALELALTDDAEFARRCEESF